MRTYGRIDVDVPGHSALEIPFVGLTAKDFLSARIGCRMYQQIRGIDLAALCIRHH